MEKYKFIEKKYYILVIMLFVCNFFFAETKKEHNVYLKGEKNGIEVRIKILTQYKYDYGLYSSIDDFLYSSSRREPKNALLVSTNSFLVEITNKSSLSIQLNNSQDSLSFICNGIQISQELEVEDGSFPNKIFSGSKVSFYIKPIYTLEDYYETSKLIELGKDVSKYTKKLGDAHTINFGASLVDFSLKNGRGSYFIYYSDKFYAVYSIGGNEIYLYLSYE